MRLAIVLVVATACGRVGFQTRSDNDAPGSPNDDGSMTSTDASMIAADAPPGTLLPAAAADTYIKGIDTTTHGSDALMLVGRNSGNGTNMFGLLSFDLAGVGASTVKVATLRLYEASSAGSTTMGIEIRRVTSKWDEAFATWADAQSGVAWMTAGGGGDFTSMIYAQKNVTPGAYGYYDFDVTTLVNEWLAGTPNFGVEIMYATQPPTGNHVAFATRDSTTAAQRPQLLVEP